MTLEASVTLHGKPRHAFAYTPTDDPRSWRLPYLTASGAPDPQTLSTSATALTEGAGLPEIAMPVIRAKMRQAFKRLGTSFEAMPTAVRESDTDDELSIEASLGDFDIDDSLDAVVEAAHKRAKRKRKGAEYREAFYAEIIEAGDDHPYGAWSGGKASSGGGPGRGSEAQRKKDMKNRVGADKAGNLANFKGKSAVKGAKGKGESATDKAFAGASEVNQRAFKAGRPIKVENVKTKADRDLLIAQRRSKGKERGKLKRKVDASAASDRAAKDAKTARSTAKRDRESTGRKSNQKGFQFGARSTGGVQANVAAQRRLETRLRRAGRSKSEIAAAVAVFKRG